jgi:hypothetical protein
MSKVLATLAVLLAAANTALAADEPKAKGAPAAGLLNAGLEQARKEDKRVFLVFGSPTCGWCRLLEKYHADPDVSRLLARHLVIVKVDIVENPGGGELYKKYGTEDRGVPAWTILAPDSQVLADSGDGRDNVGFPAEPREVDHYFKALRKACPKVSDDDVKILTASLKDVLAKK